MTGVSALEEAKTAWAGDYGGLSQAEIDERVRGFTGMLRAISAEGALSAERFAELMGLEASKAEQLFSGLAAMGMQFDESGKLVGAALTSRETPHRVRIAGRALYAWCALDTLFIPGLLREPIRVESTCPSSGESIRLRISAERVESCEPTGVWLSVFLPGASSRQVGPASPT
jgi:alkylmercury lyase